MYDEIVDIMPVSYDGETGSNKHLGCTIAVLCSSSSIHWEVWHGTQHSGAEHLNITGWIRAALGVPAVPSVAWWGHAFSHLQRASLMIWHFVG